MFPRRQKLMGKNNLIPRDGRGRNPFSFVGDPWVILEDNIIIITITILIIIVIMITTIISIRISIIVSIIITDIINIIIDITVYFLLWCRMRKLVFRDNEAGRLIFGMEVRKRLIAFYCIKRDEFIITWLRCEM